MGDRPGINCRWVIWISCSCVGVRFLENIVVLSSAAENGSFSMRLNNNWAFMLIICQRKESLSNIPTYVGKKYDESQRQKTNPQRAVPRVNLSPIQFLIHHHYLCYMYWPHPAT